MIFTKFFVPIAFYCLEEIWQNESSVNGAEFHLQTQNFEPPRLHQCLTHGSKILVSLLVVVVSVNVLCRSIREKTIFNQSDAKPQPLVT